MVDALAFSIKKAPTQSARQAKAAVVRRATADSDQTAFRSLATRCLEDSSNASRIQLKGMKLSWWQHGQTNDGGRFDHRRPGPWFPPPAGGARPMRRIDCPARYAPCTEQFTHHRSK